MGRRPHYFSAGERVGIYCVRSRNSNCVGAGRMRMGHQLATESAVLAMIGASLPLVELVNAITAQSISKIGAQLR
jgi:hypothetical protein